MLNNNLGNIFLNVKEGVWRSNVKRQYGAAFKGKVAALRGEKTAYPLGRGIQGDCILMGIYGIVWQL